MTINDLRERIAGLAEVPAGRERIEAGRLLVDDLAEIPIRSEATAMELWLSLARTATGRAVRVSHRTREAARQACEAALAVVDPLAAVREATAALAAHEAAEAPLREAKRAAMVAARAAGADLADVATSAGVSKPTVYMWAP